MRRLASRIALCAACLAGALTLAGCGTSGDDAQAEPVTVTETRTVTTPPAEATPAPAVPATPAPPAVVRRVDPPQAPAPADGRIRVPDVVGKDHQLAQDTMQAAGLYNLAEEDATGQGRALLWDRNWVVVSQSPPAGTLVAEDTTVILRSKKDGE